MSSSLILGIALPTPLKRLFDYLPPQAIDSNKLVPGIRVSVSFQGRTLVGVIIEVKKTTTIAYEKLKRVINLLDEEPLFPEDIFKLCQWAANYYHYSLGEIFANALPSLLRKAKSIANKKSVHLNELHEIHAASLTLNISQQQAIDAINAHPNEFQPFLLDGITGSGKTEIYLRVIDQVLKENKQALVLVPEISLTPQTVARFQSRFPQPLAVFHSGLKEQDRLQAWMAARCGEASIVIGTRSAIFTPFKKLGIIIVDEEHDSSFKQQDRFRYHARDLAVMRANMNKIPIVLGSATPSLESLLNVKRKRYRYLSLPQRAGKASLPQYQIIDLQKTKTEEGLSPLLLEMMNEHLQQENQVLLFLNRRGFAPVLYCLKCGFVIVCENCDARLVYHRSPPHLQCHHCNAKSHVPETCAKCGGNTLEPIGIGTQRLETLLKKYFPSTPVIRVDRDNTTQKGKIVSLLQQIHQEKKAILLGTQMLAKGHHFSRVTLVGIADADSGFYSTDFRAAEQMGQLLLQVAGRAGREDKLGTVVIQTRHPAHYLLQTLIHQGYREYAEKLLIERKDSHLPPHTYFAMFRAESKTENDVFLFLNKIKSLGNGLAQAINIFGPVPALISKRRGFYCQHLLLRSEERNTLQRFLTNLLQQMESISTKSVKWIVEVDPIQV